MRLPWSRKNPDNVILAAVACGACGAESVRAHEAGDAVLASTPCPECGAEARIERIYSAPPTRQ